MFHILGIGLHWGKDKIGQSDSLLLPDWWYNGLNAVKRYFSAIKTSTNSNAGLKLGTNMLARIPITEITTSISFNEYPSCL